MTLNFARGIVKTNVINVLLFRKNARKCGTIFIY